MSEKDILQVDYARPINFDFIAELHVTSYH